MAPRKQRHLVLLDVNVLIALAWPNHVHHQPARTWFEEEHRHGWATTPVTETGFVRVSSNRAAIATATTPALARQLLRSMTELAGHHFWVDDVPGTDSDDDADLVRTHRDVTYAHLLALADRHDGCLVTFDAGIPRLVGGRPSTVLRVLRASE